MTAQAIARECLLDPIAFCKYFLPDLFGGRDGRVPDLHVGLWAILTKQTGFVLNYADPHWLVENFVYKRGDLFYPIFEYRNGELLLRSQANTLYMLPRGFSKTTICGAAYGLYDILYQISGVQLYVSQSGPHAEAQSQTIQRQLEANEQVLSVFGNLKPRINEGKKWTDALFETTTGQIFVARGAGSQIRGQVYLGRRPRKVIFDDLEDSETVKSDTQRADLKQWAYADLFPVIEEMDAAHSEILGLGTLLHNDSLLSTIQKDPSWTVVKFGSRDKRGNLLWPEKMNEAKLMAKKTSYALMGRVDLYYMEYFNEVHAKEGAQFRREFFFYGSPSDLSELDIAIFHDPAISPKRKADSATLAVVGISRKSGKIFVLAVWGKRGATPRECLDKFFELTRIWKPRKHGFESNAYQAAFGFLLREEMFRQKIYFEPIPVHHQNKNEERISGILQARYAAGYVVHRQVFPELETELLDLGVAEHDDYATAVAGAVSLLDPFAANAGGDDLPEDQMEPLEGWRHAP